MTTDSQTCPNCQHHYHALGECDQRVEHDGQRNWHLCLCLNRQYADARCSPLMTCQGGALGYGDVWYLQRGHSLSSAGGVIMPEVLKTAAVSSAVAQSAPADRAVVRTPNAEALLLHFAAEAHRRKWSYDRGLDDYGVPVESEAFDVLHRLGEEMRVALEKLRGLAAEDRAEREAQAHLDQPAAPAVSSVGQAAHTTRSTVLREAADVVDATIAPADYRADGVSAWNTGIRIASHKLRRMADEMQPAEAEAHPPHHRWYVETRDDLANQWAPGMRFTDRDDASERYRGVSKGYPTWKDGAPVQRRFVRETTSYMVEAEPAAAEQQPKEAEGPRTVCVCGHTKGEHVTVSGRLLCDACDPDSTENLTCTGFEAL